VRSPSLVCTWLLWQAASGNPNLPAVGANVIQAYENKDDCVKAATTKRKIRKVIILPRRSDEADSRVGVEVFACLAVGADPANAQFE